MPKYGVHAFLLEGSWNNEIAPRVIAQAAELGFDFVEIPLLRPDMNIEEEGYSGPLKEAGSLCGYIHLSESNRGLPGEGTVDWEDVFAGLKAINYTGPLVLEAFAAINPDLIGATCLWHPSKYSPKELATRGLEFLKENAAKAGLA